jgi:hypothetical protein
MKMASRQEAPIDAELLNHKPPFSVVRHSAWRRVRGDTPGAPLYERYALVELKPGVRGWRWARIARADVDTRTGEQLDARTPLGTFVRERIEALTDLQFSSHVEARRTTDRVYALDALEDWLESERASGVASTRGAALDGGVPEWHFAEASGDDVPPEQRRSGRRAGARTVAERKARALARKQTLPESSPESSPAGASDSDDDDDADDAIDTDDDSSSSPARASPSPDASPRPIASRKQMILNAYRTAPTPAPPALEIAPTTTSTTAAKGVKRASPQTAFPERSAAPDSYLPSFSRMSLAPAASAAPVVSAPSTLERDNLHQQYLYAQFMRRYVEPVLPQNSSFSERAAAGQQREAAWEAFLRGISPVQSVPLPYQPPPAPAAVPPFETYEQQLRRAALQAVPHAPLPEPAVPASAPDAAVARATAAVAAIAAIARSVRVRAESSAPSATRAEQLVRNADLAAAVADVVARLDVAAVHAACVSFMTERSPLYARANTRWSTDIGIAAESRLGLPSALRALLFSPDGSLVSMPHYGTTIGGTPYEMRESVLYHVFTRIFTAHALDAGILLGVEPVNATTLRLHAWIALA